MDQDRLQRLKWLESWTLIWRDLAEVFPQSKASDRAMQLYAERLADLPIDVVRAAAEECMATCRFLPAIAELREAALRLTSPEPLSAAEAYAVAIRELGDARAEGRFPRWTDDALGETVRDCGGYHLLEMPEAAAYPRFRDAWTAKLTRREADRRRTPAGRTIASSSARAALPEPKPLALVPEPESPKSGRPLTFAETAEILRQIRTRGAGGQESTRAVADPDGDPFAMSGRVVSCPRCGLEFVGDRDCPRCVVRRMAAPAPVDADESDEAPM